MIRRATRLVLLTLAVMQLTFMLRAGIEALFMRGRIPTSYSLMAIREWLSGRQAIPVEPISLS